MRIISFVIIYLFCFIVGPAQECFTCADAPAGVIWCDDFEDNTPMADKYFEYGDDDGDFIPVAGVGRDSSTGMRVRFQKGEVSAGGMKKSLGKTPGSYIGKNAAESDKDFEEIYWRIDLRLQPGWTGGGGDKLTRATTMANSDWAQGFIAHLWSGGKEQSWDYLIMDPASGIDQNGNLVSTKYNDFDNLRWLGAKKGNIALFSEDNAGRWFCIEAHVLLNTPGQSDGIFEFWINDTLQAGTYDLNWHGDWNSDPDNYKINAVFFENYWNAGSAAEQERYFDNIVIATERIGCSCNTTTSVTPASAKNFEISPNPAKDYVLIQTNDKQTGKSFNVSVFDITGKRVIQSNHIRQKHFIVDCTTLRGGMYFYMITDNTSILQKGKFIIER